MCRIRTHHLLRGAMLAIVCAALSGYTLEIVPAPALALHLGAGLLGLAPLALFLQRHWWRRRLGDHANTFSGYAILLCITLLTVSGLALLSWTSDPRLRWLHGAASAALLLVLPWHMVRRRWTPWIAARGPHALPARRPATAAGWLLTSLAIACSLAVPGAAPAARPAAIPLAHGSLAGDHLPRANDCGACHDALTQQWRESAHAGAASNPYYLAVTGLFVQEQGLEQARFCATCHNPVGLMQGEIDASMAGAVATTPAGDESAPAYQARALGVTLSISDRADEGITCAVCHQAVPAADRPGNGNLGVALARDPLPTAPYAQLVMRAVPAQHRRALAAPALREAALCGACHNLYAADGSALEPTYDEWRASPYAEQGVTCQRCHLPPAAFAPVASSLASRAASHGSLHGSAGAPNLLQQAASLDVRWQRSTPHASGAATLHATVTVTNSGAGHSLPTGASDLRQLWLEVTLIDAQGNVRWQAGALDAFGALGSDAVQFHKVLGDARGHTIELHRIWTATQVLADTSLAPRESRAIAYTIPLPADAPTPYRLQARLLYRKVSPAFAEFALGHPVHDLPGTEMASASTVVP